MDLSNLLGGLGAGGAQVDPNRLISGVQEVFASKGGVEGLIAAGRWPGRRRRLLGLDGDQ